MSTIDKAARAEQRAWDAMTHAQAQLIAVQLETVEHERTAAQRETIAKLRRRVAATTQEWNAAARRYETVNERYWEHVS